MTRLAAPMLAAFLAVFAIGPLAGCDALSASPVECEGGPQGAHGVLDQDMRVLPATARPGERFDVQFAHAEARSGLLTMVPLRTADCGSAYLIDSSRGAPKWEVMRDGYDILEGFSEAPTDSGRGVVPKVAPKGTYAICDLLAEEGCATLVVED